MTGGARGRRSSRGIVLGQLFGQLALVAVTPVLTRQYDPAVLGLFQVALAVAATAQPLATLRTEFVIPSAHSHEVAGRLRTLGILWGGGLGVLIALGGAVGMLLQRTDIATVLVCTALISWGMVWLLVDNAMLLRNGDLHRLAWRNLIGGVGGAVLQLVACVAGAPVVALAASLLAARAAAVLLTSRRGGTPPPDSAGEDTPYGVRRIAHSVGAGLAASATGQSLTVLVGPSLGPQAAGFAGVAQRIAGGPLSLLGQGLGQALQADLAPVLRERRTGVRRRLRRQVYRLGLLAVITSTVLIVLAPPLAEPLLGPGWAMAGTITAILAVPLSAQLVVGPLMPVLPMMGRESLLLRIQLGRLIAVIAPMVAALVSGAGLVVTTIVFSVATLCSYAVMIVFVFREVRRWDEELQR